MLERPFLIQRCEVEPGRLRYQYMGSAEFEFGARAESLKRLFAKELCLLSTTLRVKGKEVPVYLIASGDFSLDDYQPYLEQMAVNDLYLKEMSEFHKAIEQQRGVKLNWEVRANVWFDIENDVLWTLTEENQQVLLECLRDINKAWEQQRA